MSHSVGLALLSKIHDLLTDEENGQTVSFLTLAEIMDIREVAFDLPLSQTGLSEREQVNYSGAFSRRVNTLPGEGYLWSNSNIYLWTVYREVLEGPVDLAKNPTSSDVDAKIKEAKELLGSHNEPSEQYKTYLSYRNQANALLKKIGHIETIISHTSNDDKDKPVRQRELGSLQEELQFLQSDWMARGFKNEIEEALYIASQENSGNYIQKWRGWKEDLISSGPQNDKDGEFWPTSYSPDLFYNNDHVWVGFTYTGDEVEKLAQGAPPELVRFQESLGSKLKSDGDVNKLSFEIAKVLVRRPWFHPELLKSKFWRWGIPGHQLLSDGSKTDPKGLLPKYIIEIVLIRNLKIDWSTPPQQDEKKIISMIGNIAFNSKEITEQGKPLVPISGDKIIKLFPEGPTPFPPDVDPLPDTLIRNLNKLADHSLLSELDRVRILDVLHEGRNVIRPEVDTVQSWESSTVRTESVFESSLILVGYVIQKAPKSPDPDPSLSWV